MATTRQRGIRWYNDGSYLGEDRAGEVWYDCPTLPLTASPVRVTGKTCSILNRPRYHRERRMLPPEDE